MEEKGFKYQTEGGGDFPVTYYVSGKEELDVESFDYGFPHRQGWSPDIWTRYYTEGSVIVDFIDPQTKQLAWRSGSAT